MHLPRSREQKADAFDDLASALDAGVPLDAIASASAERDPIAALEAGGHALDPVERRVFEAAVTAGELPAALRERAESQRFFAKLQREVLGQLAYPAFLTVFALGIATLVSATASGPGVPLLALFALTAVAVILVLLVTRARKNDRMPWMPGPMRQLLLAYGEIPYLSALHGLYRAGVPILEGHETATGAAPVGETRARLERAGEIMSARNTLGEALATTQAVQTETLQVLTLAEQSGDLEDGLARAYRRRRDVFERNLKRSARVVGAVAYALAVLIAAYVILDFYGSLYGRFR